MNKETQIISMSLEDYTTLLEYRLKLNTLTRYFNLGRYVMDCKDYEKITGIHVGPPEGQEAEASE